MAGELVHKPRVVRCPKCKLLLPEPPECDVYKCGGCGITLQAKKRRSVDVNSESSTQETNAASRNSLDLVSGDKQCSNGKQLAAPGEDVSKAKATSSSSGECYLDANVGSDQKENGECIADQLQPFNLSDEEQESELDIYKLTLRRRRLSNNGCSNKTTHSETEEINSGNLLLEGSKDEFIRASDENDKNEKSAPAGVMSQMEITASDSEVAEELNHGNLLLGGAEEELISGSAGEDDNKDKSAIADVNPEVEIKGSGSEGAEELNNENLVVEEAGENLISGSDGEDANKDKSALAGANAEVEITKSDLEGAEELNNGNLLLKGAEEELISGLDGEDANNELALVGENLGVETTRSNISGEELNNGKHLQEGAKEELHICGPDGEDPNNEQPAPVGANSEVDITESTSTTKSSSAKNFVSKKQSILPVPPEKVEEGTSAGNPPTSNKLQKQAQRSIRHSYERVRSVDALDTTELINPTSEISGTLSKSRTTRSSHAYDGSLSSYDGMDEQFPIQHLDSFENPYTFASSVSEEMTRKGKGLVNGMSYGDLGRQHQSYLPNGKHHVIKDNRGNQNKVLETTRHGHRHWMRAKRDELPPRMPFHRSGSQSRYESSGPSNQMYGELHRRSSFLSPESRQDTHQEKMKLLRMIYELQDQLNRTRYASGETNGRLSTGVPYKGKHISAYHRHDGLHEGRFSHGMDYPTCDGRCSHAVNWRQRHKFSQIPYSDEATSSADHVDHSCSHCYPKVRHFSADLPPRALLHHEELYRSYPGQDCFSPRHSYPSSPQWFTPSKLAVYGGETKSNDHKHRAHKVRRYLREKQHSAKRNSRPVAGGAPFVTCHKCLNLLQLPADFLLSTRGRHQLKCGECSEVLKFSLQNGSLVSHSSNALGPPSGDLSDQHKVTDSSSVPSTSHANYYQYHYSHADSISYSDDYGLSVSKSHSSEDPISLTQFHPLHGRDYGNSKVSLSRK